MPQVDINYLAVLVCAGMHMVLGALWYSPLLLGKKWMRVMGKTEEEIKTMGPPAWVGYVVSFIAALIMAYVLAHIIDYAQAETFTSGLQGGFWVWLGFVIMGGLGGILFEGRHKALYFIYNGYYFVSLLLMGGILAIWV